MEPSKELSSLLDRSDADVRGVKKRASSGSGDSTAACRSGPVSRQGSLNSQPSDNYRTMTDILSTARVTPRQEFSTGEPNLF